MNAGSADDEMGIRNTPPNLVYANMDRPYWYGSGILNKPISDFYQSSFFDSFNFTAKQSPYFAGQGVRVSIHSRVIPEPAEYALVFGLFAIGFIFFRHF